MPDTRSVAVAYVEAMGRRDAAALGALFAPDVTFRGPGGTLSGAAVLPAYTRLFPILKTNELRKVFVDGDEACVIYDFVTDTPAGAVTSVEWLRIEGGKVRSTMLLFDMKNWPAVLKELESRSP